MRSKVPLSTGPPAHGPTCPWAHPPSWSKDRPNSMTSCLKSGFEHRVPSCRVCPQALHIACTTGWSRFSLRALLAGKPNAAPRRRGGGKAS